MVDARSDSLPWMSTVVKPGVPRGTRKPRMPSSVRAHTVATSAMLPLVIHILLPVSSQSSPSRTARVGMPAGFEPKSGSVSPKQPIAVAGRQPGQPFLLLLLGAVAPDREHGQRALHRHEAAQAAVAGLQFQTGQPVADRVGACAAVAGQVHAEQAELAEFRREFLGRHLVLEPLRDVRADVVGHEVTDGALDEPFLVGEQRVERRSGRRRWPRGWLAAWCSTPVAGSRRSGGTVRRRCCAAPAARCPGERAAAWWPSWRRVPAPRPGSPCARR